MTTVHHPAAPLSPRGLLSHQEASEYTGLSTSQLNRLRWEHKIEYYRLGNVVRYSREQLDAYIESCRVLAAEAK